MPIKKHEIGVLLLPLWGIWVRLYLWFQGNCHLNHELSYFSRPKNSGTSTLGITLWEFTRELRTVSVRLSMGKNTSLVWHLAQVIWVNILVCIKCCLWTHGSRFRFPQDILNHGWIFLKIKYPLETVGLNMKNAVV